MSKKYKIVLRVFLACLLLTAAITTKATENGLVHYPIGANTIMNAALPLPGETALYVYVANYHSTRLNDSHGKSVDDGFRLDVQAWAPRLMHTWEQKLGPFALSSAIITPMSRVDIDLFGRHEVSTGFTDPVLTPLYLYYASPDFDFFAYGGVDFYVPIGKYDKDRLANHGLNFWAIGPNVNFTWLPTPKIDISATFYTEFNAENKATNYRSGNNATLDFGASYRAFDSAPQVRVALQGFAFKQFSDDKLNGDTYLDGNRGQVFAFGPQISYDFKGGSAVMVKYQKEFKAENRPEGDRFWIQVALPF